MASKTLLYIHGFNSAGQSAKVDGLRSMLPGVNVLSPTLDYKNAQAALRTLESLCMTRRPQAVMGTSLGGFFAMICGCRHSCHSILINPTTDPYVTLRGRVGENRNFVTGRRYVFTHSDLDGYRVLKETVFDALEPRDGLVHFALATDDEVLGDHRYLEQKYPMLSDFRYYDGVGHRFPSLRPIVRMVRDALDI